ncbi:PLP-dependent aminotransferase family protein [Ralstonia solanacearum]|uniref:MocR-like pyridoxine biosynthesis transcription factor PdxR n=1 Tax=Ralstonia solanacearum TaxID=305 RepID=UPI0005C517BB|nr:PLP-dependent aminotransferase family protein [Ralstonia solanacearum]MBB6589989.1 PLP-dependent aminotransferase family protein [Ralstonia solanacearum]MBB6594186.1 PLP-dependent aminotransferase family protein [Ralstonia solanacearum]MDB0542883.1 PLP-dependent aminotransferase family protein [Ralstonia solanacearum]MDB0553116.1 PLP-dependent aminotransferase family protein [Ralstonia solanacearum]MDB0557889.1 PLP-dependent aminotransferase family protein [Ralstonia solanacearum]
MDYGVLLSTYEREIGREAAARMPQQHRLYACLRAAILSGKIEEGTQLLASRTLAEELSMARNSVLYAYERLASEGFVVGRRQGTVVARVGVPQAPAVVPGDVPILSRRVAHIERPGDGMDDPLPFLPGTPALDAFPLAPWRRSVERAWRNIGPAQLGYMPVEGNAALRQAIAEYLRVSRGVRCEAGQVFVTDGTQNGLDLCARTLADAGDTAWLENPGYLGARHAFQAADLRLVPIPIDADGLAPRPEDWRDRPPRLIYITPSHQYPLGAVMSLERRLALLAQAHAAGAWIIEDDYDSEFRHQGAPLSAVQGLAEDAPVIYLGTFSKVMFPALRLGFMVVPPALASVLRRTAGALMLRGRVAEQLALADFIDAGHFTRHLRRMRRLYAERRAALQGALEARLSGLLTVSGGAGGMHLSARLDVPARDTEVSRAGRARGLVLRPLSRFCLPGTEGSYNGLVLGYGGVSSERMDEAVSQVREVIVGMMG